MTTERRYSPRVTLYCEAKVFFANQCLAGRLVDLSATGMALTVSSEQTPSSALRIQFTPPNQRLPALVDAILVRHRQCDSEVEWGLKLLSPLPEGVGEAAPERSRPFRINHAKEWLHELEASLARRRRMERDQLSGS